MICDIGHCGFSRTRCRSGAGQSRTLRGGRRGARDGQGVALVVLQGVSAVPGGEAEELIDGEFDGGMFEV